MRIGIIFGGPSREREISFAGGRTVYDNLNKSLFDPVPIFVDSHLNFIELDWPHVYKGSIRDFYPPVMEGIESDPEFQLYVESLGVLSEEVQEQMIQKVGKRIIASELKNHMDFAFLALHGPFGEDGKVQKILEDQGLLYSGSGIKPSEIGIDKAYQKELLESANFYNPDSSIIERAQWLQAGETNKLFDQIKKDVGIPFVVKPATQGSSVGVSIVNKDDINLFDKAMNRAFFVYSLSANEWSQLSDNQQVKFIKEISDLKEGVGIPISISIGDQSETSEKTFYHPRNLHEFIISHFGISGETLLLESIEVEEKVIAERFIEGKEFSCIVIQDESGVGVALPPTEIIKGGEVFDYRSKYLPGLSRKVTPIDLPEESIERIRTECEKLFSEFKFNVYARIDGFFVEDDDQSYVYLNDPNTTSGMLPSSFFFHQAAEIGLNPSQFLTYIIRTSISERIRTNDLYANSKAVLDELDNQIKKSKGTDDDKIKIAVLLGGYSTERHISVDSGRNIYEKLAASSKYKPTPVFLTLKDPAAKEAILAEGDLQQRTELFQLPINLLLKDNADDIRDKLYHQEFPEIVAKIRSRLEGLTSKYAYSSQIFQPVKIEYAQLVKNFDAVYIALHGRPGEDGTIQQEFERLDIPYNGSGVESSQITIDKHETNILLTKHGFKSLKQVISGRTEWGADRKHLISEIDREISYPYIAKPVDEGCSSAVKKIEDIKGLEAYADIAFRPDEKIPVLPAELLNLKPKEEFPSMERFLIEELVIKGDANSVIEITGGLKTSFGPGNELIYEVFELSEAISNSAILSLEEKFLAGEGQNITPVRFSDDIKENEGISKEVRKKLEEVARIFNLEGYARIDAFVKIYRDKNNVILNIETIILEVNSLPGMTPATVIFHQAALQGYKPYDFIDGIIEYGVQRHKIGKATS
ncbi:MAG: D-alanine--D-alanine ligase [Bacteroidetes bacterium]|nr:D-alanine--D-alanine ligase [Bacteroidota bacterium]